MSFATTSRALIIAAALVAVAAPPAPAQAQYIEKRSGTSYGHQTVTKPKPGPVKSRTTQSEKSATPRTVQRGTAQSQTNAVGQTQQRR